jgi:hypothetical protein
MHPSYWHAEISHLNTYKFYGRASRTAFADTGGPRTARCAVRKWCSAINRLATDVLTQFECQDRCLQAGIAKGRTLKHVSLPSLSTTCTRRSTDMSALRVIYPLHTSANQGYFKICTPTRLFTTGCLLYTGKHTGSAGP